MSERIRVLVVDDSEFFGTLVAGELERLYDMETVKTTSSYDALDALEDGSFDCIVSDYDMPEIDGIELYETVRELGLDLPFFLLTAAGSEEVASTAITAGIDDYFAKTGGDDQFEILGNRIETVVTKRRTAANLERQRTLHETLWNVTQDLLHAGTREQICSRVCRALVDIEGFGFAWVETAEETIVDSAGLDAVEPSTVGGELPTVTEHAATVRTCQTQVAEQGKRTLMVVPLEHRGTIHGRLVLGAKQGSTFREPDEQSLSHLGTTVGHALAAVEMRREVELFQTAVEQAETAIAITDTAGEIAFANSAFQDITGYEPETLQGLSVDCLASESFDTEDYRALWERVGDGETVRTEVVQRRKDGRQFVADLSVAPVSVGGELQRFILVESDITELKSREQRLDVLNRIIRHNLRNDLNVVTGNISLLLSQIDSAEGREYAERAQSKIDDLLDMSEKARLANRVVEGVDEGGSHNHVPLSSVVEAVVSQVAEDYPEADLNAAVDVTGSVPEGPLGIGLRELVTNAIIHNDSETPRVRVSATESTTHEGMMAIDVTDNGPGIPSVERRTLAQERETDLEHSSSLGLWLVHWVVTFLGGELRIVEASESGSTVRVIVPPADEAA